MLKPEVPPDQLERIQPILEPLLARLHAKARELSPDADSALTFHSTTEDSR